jgi:bifunctional pyridoxal-dependent enzyme with beta-cystathionase and maltose regulon repressor activities
MTSKFLERHQIPYKKGSNAGLFIWVDLFAPIQAQVSTALKKQVGIHSDTHFAYLQLKPSTTLLKHRIFLALGADFGGDIPGWFRIVFAHEKTYLQLGLDRMIEAVEVFRREL